MVTMQQAISAFVSVLDSSDVHYELASNGPDGNGIILQMTVPNRLRRVTMIIAFDAASNDPDVCVRVVSVAYADISVDNNCVAQMCEYLTRINDTIIIGGMEMSVDACENIRYRLSVEIDDYMLSDTLVRRMLIVPLQVMEQYGDGLLAISMGLISAKEAYRQAKNKQ